MAGRIFVGTSGYVYRDWRGVFYPKGLAGKDWLEHYARSFRTLELNATFYRLPSHDTVRRWRDQTPPDFLFAAKGSRFLTHMKRLTDAALGLTRYYERALLLGDKLGVVLWQLPPQMTKADVGRLDAFLSAQPKGLRQAVEFRHEAWYTREVADCLDRRGAAFCEHDLVALRVPRRTGGFRYIRFHGSRPMERKYHGRYGAARLRPVAQDLERGRARGEDAFVYFNNDWHGAALYDARELSELVGRRVEAALP
jgi:uncharacterized protein YecE (DUF72 family)